MEISLFHHLSGAWLGYHQAIAEYPELSQSGAIAESFWQAFLKGESTEIIPNQAIEWSDCPLENALAMLPMLLYYHEDPIYLSDRLEKLSLPSEELVIAKDLGQCLSSILRETVQVDRFTEWLDERSPELADETTFLRSSYEKNLSWHSFNKALAVHSFSKTSQQLLQIYGVMLWSYGQIPQMKVLSAQCSPIIQAWVLVLMGSHICASKTESYQQARLLLMKWRILLFG